MNIKFFTTEEVSPTEIYRRLNNVFGEHTDDVSKMRLWVRNFKNIERDLLQARSGRPTTAVKVDIKSRVDELIKQGLKQQQ